MTAIPRIAALRPGRDAPKGTIRYAETARDGTRPDPDRILFVGPGTPWSTPFHVGRPIGTNTRGANYARRARLSPEHTPKTALEAYGLYVIWVTTCAPYAWSQLREVADASALACWCAYRDPCHADHLARIVEGARADGRL